MSEHEVDARLRALFNEQPAVADPAFSDRIIALAAYDRTVRRARQRVVHRTISETLALMTVLVTFILLARAAPASTAFGDTIPLASPAMLGLAMLVLWALVSIRPAAIGR